MPVPPAKFEPRRPEVAASPTRRARPRIVRRRPTCLALLLLAPWLGCAKDNGDIVKNLTKALETQAYDELAEVYSAYCASLYDKGVFVAHTRIEMAREIRQSARAHHGPVPPGRRVGSFTRPDEDDALPDENTRMGRGPVVMIYCEGDEVPPDVWRLLDRYWQD